MADRRWDNVLNFSTISIVKGNFVSRSRRRKHWIWCNREMSEANGDKKNSKQKLCVICVSHVVIVMWITIVNSLCGTWLSFYACVRVCRARSVKIDHMMCTLRMRMETKFVFKFSHSIIGISVPKSHCRSHLRTRIGKKMNKSKTSTTHMWVCRPTSDLLFVVVFSKMSCYLCRSNTNSTR